MSLFPQTVQKIFGQHRQYLCGAALDKKFGLVYNIISYSQLRKIVFLSTLNLSRNLSGKEVVVMTGTVRHEYDKRVIRTKKAIRAALFKIMESKNITDITISELTAEAGVNRRTFYTHYRNITDILVEVENDFLKSLKNLTEDFDTCDYESSAYKLFIGFDNLVSGEFSYYFHLVHVDMRGVLMSRLKSIIKRFAEEIVEQISRKRGSDAATIAAFIAGGFFNVYLEYINSDDLSVEHAAEIASAMVAICAKSSEDVVSHGI